MGGDALARAGTTHHHRELLYRTILARTCAKHPARRSGDSCVGQGVAGSGKPTPVARTTKRSGALPTNENG